MRKAVPFLFPLFIFCLLLSYISRLGGRVHQNMNFWQWSLGSLSQFFWCRGIRIELELFFSPYVSVTQVFSEPSNSRVKATQLFNILWKPSFFKIRLDFWEMVEFDGGWNLSSITSFVYSFKYFEDLLCVTFALGALFLRNYLIAF